MKSDYGTRSKVMVMLRKMKRAGIKHIPPIKPGKMSRLDAQANAYRLFVADTNRWHVLDKRHAKMYLDATNSDYNVICIMLDDYIPKMNEKWVRVVG